MTPQQFSEYVTSATRPIIALAFTGMIIGAVFTGHDIPEWARNAALLAIGWWFIDRTVQKVLTTVSGKPPATGPFVKDS